MGSQSKIHITGSVGSGKTTLAKKLSEKLSIPYYEIDNIIFERHPSGDIRRSDTEIITILEKIIYTEMWILEGTCTKDWITKSFNKADHIILLDIPYLTRLKRIIFRYIKQLLKLEAANYKPTITMFIHMLKWNHKFNKINKFEFFKLTQQYREKIIVYTNNYDV